MIELGELVKKKGEGGMGDPGLRFIDENPLAQEIFLADSLSKNPRVAMAVVSRSASEPNCIDPKFSGVQHKIPL